MKKLYYTPPSEECFNELKQKAIEIWQSYDNTYGYVDAEDNGNWNTQLVSNYRRPIYRVECTEDNFYLTNQDYFLGQHKYIILLTKFYSKFYKPFSAPSFAV